MFLCTRHKNSNILLLNFRRNSGDCWEEQSDLQSTNIYQRTLRTIQYEKFRYETVELENGLHALILHYDTLNNTLALQTVRTIQLLLELCKMAYFFKQGTVYTKRIDNSLHETN